MGRGRSVSGARVVLTGASSGIGATLAPMLAERGATVGLVARRADRLEEVLERCLAHSPGHRSFVVDLGDLAAAGAMVDEAWAALGGVDVLINNAAIPKRRTVTELTEDELDEVMRVNFFSPTRLTMALLPRWVDRGAGMVVNVSSLGGRLGIVHESAYCAAKFAMCGWSEAMAMDLVDSPVEVRLVIPGPIATEIWDHPDSDPPTYDGPLEPPEVVAEGIIAAIGGDTFEHYLPDLRSVVEFKTTDIDTYIEVAAHMGDASRDDASEAGA
jgi:short-subunit dehydrogenase